MSTTMIEPKNKRWQRILQNPITVKELRSRMRGNRAFLVLTLHLMLLSLLVGIIYTSYAANENRAFGPNSRDAGSAVFTAIIVIQTFVALFVAPAFTAGAITGEKERQTYDILRTTLLTARQMVSGKLFSALSYIFLLLLTSIPIQSVAFFLGGISVAEVIIAQLLLTVTAILFALIGLYFSSVMRSTLAATVATFGTGLFFIVGIPALVGISMSFAAPLLFGFSAAPSWTAQVVLIYAGIFLAATNLPATIIVSEIFLRENGKLWGITETIDSHTIWIPSPWYLNLVVYSLLALFFFWLTIRRVKKVADK